MYECWNDEVHDKIKIIQLSFSKHIEYQFSEGISVPWPWPPALAEICVYRPWTMRIGNNKCQSLDIMLLFLFLLSNPFVMVIADRNETKGNFSKKQSNKYN